MSDRERKRRSHRFTRAPDAAVPSSSRFQLSSVAQNLRRSVPLKPLSHRRCTLALLPDHVAHCSLIARSTTSNFLPPFPLEPHPQFTPWPLQSKPHTAIDRERFSRLGKRRPGKGIKYTFVHPCNAPTYTTSSNFELRGCWVPLRPLWPKHSAE